MKKKKNEAAQALGRIKTEKKASAARANGAKGGRPQAILAADIWCTTLANGKEIDEGTIEAGARIRRITKSIDGLSQPVWTFQCSTDGGKRWFAQRSHAEPHVCYG